MFGHDDDDYYYLFYIRSSTVQLHKYEEADGTKKIYNVYLKLGY